MRRKSLVVFSLLLVASLMAAIGTGAIDVFSAARAANVSVVNDAAGFVGIKSESKWAFQDGQGRLYLDFTANNPNAVGEGFNRTSTTEVRDVFSITNQSTQPVYVWLEPGDKWVGKPEEMLIYKINRDNTNGNITETTHYSHGKLDLLSKFVAQFNNGVKIAGEPYYSAYVHLDPGEKVTVDLICQTAGNWWDNQTYWDGDLKHSIVVRANVDAPKTN